MSLLETLIAQRDQQRRALAGELQVARSSGRDALLPSERAAIDQLQALDSHIQDLQADEARRGSTPNLPGKKPAMNSNVYRRDGKTSYLRDLMRVSLPGMDSDGTSHRRLAEYAGETESRDLDRLDGTGGYAVPPSWLVDQYIELARPGRAFANLCTRAPLPGGTDSINIPKIISGTATAIQTADNTKIEEVDLTDSFISAPVRTIAGEQGVALQLLDQSPISFDEVIIKDLTADLAVRTDLQCLEGSGVAGQVLGLSNTPGIQVLPVGSQDVAGLYGALAHAIDMIHSVRYASPDAILMHPRRWAWLTSQLDDQQRPLFAPMSASTQNAVGTISDVAPENVVGRLLGLPVVTDPNLSTFEGAGDEDDVYVLRASDITLWESGVRSRVLPEPRASTLTVLIQTYSYLAFSAERHPESVVQITGFAPPAWT